MIKLNNISKKYTLHNETYFAIKNICLVLPDTGLILLKGKSGSGKTTLLNIISKVDNPSTGEIVTIPDYNNASIVYQDSQIIEDISIYQNLMLIAEMYGKSNEQVNDLMNRFDLMEIKNKRTNQISGGEKQRISIIRALIADCPVLLCDEPTANLDVENAKIVVGVLKDISKEKLVIVSSHDIDLFEEEIDGYIELSKGEIIHSKIDDKGQKLNYSSIEIKKLSLSSLFKLSFKGIKRTISRYVFLCISLILSLLIVIFSINILFLNPNVIKNEYNNTLDYINYQKTYDGGVETMYDSDYEAINSDYIEVCYQKVEIKLYRNYTIGDMIYYAEECPYEMIIGTPFIMGYEIIIPSKYADDIIENTTLSTYEDLIGKKVNCFTIEAEIKGIYNSKNLSEGYIPIIARKDYIYPANAKDIYSSCIFNYFNDNINKVESIEFDDPAKIHHTPTVGRSVEEDDEIIIPYSEAIGLVDYDKERLGELIGTNWEKFNYQFVKASFYQKNDGRFDYYTIDDFKMVSQRYKFKIVGISNTGYQVSDNVYNYLIENFVTGDFLFGFAINGHLTIDQYNKMHSNGYVDYTQYSYEIDNAFKIIPKITIVTSIVGMILVIITICILFNYFSFSQSKKYKEIGILTSFGAKKKQMIEYLLIDVFVAATFSLILANSLIPLLDYITNIFVVKNDFLSINILYYSWQTSLISILILFIFYFISIFYAYFRNRKKTIYDLIYERK